MHKPQFISVSLLNFSFSFYTSLYTSIHLYIFIYIVLIAACSRLSSCARIYGVAAKTRSACGDVQRTALCPVPRVPNTLISGVCMDSGLIRIGTGSASLLGSAELSAGHRNAAPNGALRPGSRSFGPIWRRSGGLRPGTAPRGPSWPLMAPHSPL